MTRRSDIIRSLAKILAATAFGGPLAGAGAAVNEAIDLVGGWLGGRDRDVYRQTLRRIERDLDQLASSERLESGLVDQALLQTEALLARHGATVGEMNRLGLDPDRIARVVLARGAADVAVLDEGARELCARAVHTMYSAVVADAEGLPGLATAYKREVLARLDQLPRLPNAVATVLQSAAASALVGNPSRTWRADLFAPSSLLRAEYGIVPFQGRESELSELEEWCGDARPLALRLYTGAGGMGKTRLMIQLVSRLTRNGWRAGFLSAELTDPAPLAWLLRDTAHLLLVVDYAETRRLDVRKILRAALQDAGGCVRIVLLARARADWWRDLLREGSGVGDVLQGPATTAHSLTALASGVAERQAVFDSAAHSFAAVLNRPLPAAGPPALVGDHYERVLFLHLAALAAVEGEQPQDAGSLLDFALRREQAFWDQGMRAAGLDHLAGRPIAQAAAVATLAGRAGDRSEARALLAGASLLAGQPPAVVDTVAELLHRLYPSEHWLQGVQPDLLGEHLVGQAIADDSTLLGVLRAE
ncbi:hypothetical protein [Streptomyces sp. MN13]